MRQRIVIAWIVLASLAMWPLFSVSELVGAGPDVISTVWGLWWAQDAGFASILGQETSMVNHPSGASGAVLSPTSTIAWGLLSPFLGVAFGYALTCWLQLFATMAAVAWLARINGASHEGAVAAALFLLVGRYFLFGIGEGSVVAVLCLTVVLGLGCLQQLYRSGKLRWAIGICACTVLTALENPYLTPILPIVMVICWMGRKRHRTLMFFVGLVSLFALLQVAQLFGASASPDYPREVAGQQVHLAGQFWQVVDLPWARLSPLELLDPRPVVWTTNAENATLASGGLFIGWTLLIGASMGALHKKMWPWVVLMLTMAVLSMGSIWGGFAMPFLGLNAIMDAIARPLTQPTRYLAVAIVAGAVLAGVWFSSQNRNRQWALVTLMLIESLFFGGLSLKLPTTELPQLSCQLPEGGVLLWPGDAEDGEQGRSQLFQMVHAQPSPQTGIASWKLADDRVLGKLRGAGFGQQSTGLKTNKLIELGYRSVLLDRSAIAAEELQELVQRLRPGVVAEDCGDGLLVPLVGGGL